MTSSKKRSIKWIVMGVSGVGKSTIGKALGDRLSVPFFDADDFHPSSNIEKMANGRPLTDEDRWPWLKALAGLLRKNSRDGFILACSALKSSYREILKIDDDVRFLLLLAAKETIKARMAARKDHFMPESLLDSQLDALEAPKDSIRVDMTGEVDQIVDRIISENIEAL